MYSNREYYEMVRVYIQSGESLYEARRLYETESIPRLRAQGLSNPTIPHRNTILAVNQRLLDYGQFTVPTHASGSGRPNQITIGVEDEVLDYFERNPRSSTNDAARVFNLSQPTVWKIVNKAGLHPYHYQRVQHLNDADAVPRRVFCEWLVRNQNVNILWTDEALFTRIGLYNRRNEHWWSFRNPHVIREDYHQVRFSVNVWAGIIGNTILGPYFIQGHLTGGTYLDMLRGVITEFLENVPIAYLRDFYYQQDGAPPHYARDVREYLNSEYGERWIGRGGPVSWPPRSPDLTPCDFFLWGEIKRLVYREELQSLEDLRLKIMNAFEIVKSDSAVLDRLRTNVVKRARLCLERNGLHFEQLLQYD